MGEKIQSNSNLCRTARFAPTTVAIYTTPYYDGLKAHGIRLPAMLQLIRTDKARIEKPTDATMWRNMFLAPRYDGCANTLDTGPTSNLIMTWNTKRHTSENCDDGV